jgi:hypothetical protein
MIYQVYTGGHDGRFDCGWTPFRVERFEKADNAGNMRARHRSSREHVIRKPTFIKIYFSYTYNFAVSGNYIHPWCSDIRLKLYKKACK